MLVLPSQRNGEEGFLPSDVGSCRFPCGHEIAFGLCMQCMREWEKEEKHGQFPHLFISISCLSSSLGQNDSFGEVFTPGFPPALNSLISCCIKGYWRENMINLFWLILHILVIFPDLPAVCFLVFRKLFYVFCPEFYVFCQSVRETEQCAYYTLPGPDILG